MEKVISIPKENTLLTSLVRDVNQGARIRLVQAGKSVAMVVPFEEKPKTTSAQFMEAYRNFRKEHDWDHLDIDFEEELKAHRYRGTHSGREVRW
jgi:antitoxin (DNA-binding transcriptional repressor) of toxin-antitoxin stability system